MGQAKEFIGNKKRHTKLDYIQVYNEYQAKNCNKCSMRDPCNKAEGNCIIEVNLRSARYKQLVRENPISEKNYNTEVRDLRMCKKFKIFMLRGLEKVEIEAGLLSLAHNLRKMAN